MFSSASRQRVSDERWWTCTLLPVVNHRTKCIRSASSWFLTRIHALLVEAHQLTRASSVGSTSNHACLSLAHFSISTVVVASAYWFAGSSIASFIVQASLIVGTHWSAQILDTGCALRTVSVLRTLQCWCTDAANLRRRTWNHAVDARATGTMIHYRTSRVWTTWVFLARIGTFVGSACFTRTTIVVRMASVDAASVKADVS